MRIIKDMGFEKNDHGIRFQAIFSDDTEINAETSYFEWVAADFKKNVGDFMFEKHNDGTSIAAIMDDGNGTIVYSRQVL